MAQIIVSEFSKKIGFPVSFVYRRLAAADIAAHVRSFGHLIAAGVDRAEAAEVAGLAL